ncbi:hypothetical protein [Yinghuangia soli]|uniref:Uncharacterized protein n=1 Tax=Yinghuangia soli TaxID=2908204 RepID=A0AA41PVZ8_9ACTN|nr:hypothetical protein [Yinghuangia soli]MCF2526721.1 hypothetical protein [Yinghuangia soli]
MNDITTTWRRMLFVAPFVVLLILAVVYACDVTKPPGSTSPAATGPSAPPTGSTAPTDAPATEGGPGEATPPAAEPTTALPTTPPTPMDRHDDPPPPTSAPPPPPPQAAQVDMKDPSAVSRAAVLTMWTVDTTKDANAEAGTLRAAPFLSPALVQAAREGAAIRPSQAWLEMAGHQGRTVATAVPNDEAGKPPDTPTTALRTWAVTVSPVADSGWRGVPDTLTVYVTLGRSAVDQPWRVTGYELD